MKLQKLVHADIYRDGGSYEAAFSTDDGLGYSLWLQRSSMPDEHGLHHRWLFEFRGFERPENCPPVITGSQQEQELIYRLNTFLENPKVDVPFAHRTPANYYVERLREMLGYIQRRDPCFPSDLRMGEPMRKSEA